MRRRAKEAYYKCIETGSALTLKDAITIAENQDATTHQVGYMRTECKSAAVQMQTTSSKLRMDIEPQKTIKANDIHKSACQTLSRGSLSENPVSTAQPADAGAMVLQNAMVFPYDEKITGHEKDRFTDMLACLGDGSKLPLCRLQKKDTSEEHEVLERGSRQVSGEGFGGSRTGAGLAEDHLEKSWWCDQKEVYLGVGFFPSPLVTTDRFATR